MPFMVAATQSGSSGLSMLMVLLPIVLVALMFFSQRRRSQAASRAQAELTIGDEVRTTSGLFGRLTGLDDTVGHVEIAPGTVVKFDRRALLPVEEATRAAVATTGEHEGANAASTTSAAGDGVARRTDDGETHETLEPRDGGQR